KGVQRFQRILSILRTVQISDGDSRRPIDAVLVRLFALEYEVDFLDRDLLGQRRQLVENLTRLRTRFTAEGLRKEQQTNGPRHCCERIAELLLIGRRN